MVLELMQTGMDAIQFTMSSLPIAGSLYLINKQVSVVDHSSLEILIKKFESGEITQEELVKRLESGFLLDLGYARLDTHRSLRQGFPEVIYGPGKTPDQVAHIVKALLDQEADSTVLLSRATPSQLEAAKAIAGEPVTFYHGLSLSDSGHFSAVWNPAPLRSGISVCVITGGTADLAVATEVTAVLYAFGVSSDLISDCGVAGIHRLLEQIERVRSADIVVVVAGMEGAIASVVGGLVRAPVIAVPTSTGYGASLDGVTALLSMLASCAPGLTVVGIDNGFGAAASAIRILDYGTSRLD